MSTKQSDIEKFDRAVFEYLTTICSKIVYAPTQKAFPHIAKREEFSDQKPWNFLSFYRSPNFEINWSAMNNPGTVSGDMVRLHEIDSIQREARYVQNIPVNLTYSVNIWASRATEVQEMAIALISKLFMEDQVLLVPLNPGGEVGRFHILDISWDDNSDIERETDIGKIYRHTVEFTIDARITLVRDVQTTKFGEVPIDIYE